MRKLKKEKMIKHISFLLLIIFLFQINVVFANLEDNEKVDVEKIREEVIQTSATLYTEPKLNSRIAVIYDRASGRILYQKNANKQTPMASTTKIMTAIVVVENSNLTDVVTIENKAASVGGSRLGLKKNDKITVNDLLYGLMLCSGNDAALALAIHVGGSVEGFAEMMNRKAVQMGLVNSHFVVPHGLDVDKHYTTAYELAKMADYALNVDKIRQIVGTKNYTVTINGNPKAIKNTNELLGNLSGVYGVKTGFTNGAGRCLVTACKRDDLDIITVVLGADTKKYRTSDSIKLIEYADQNYEMINIKQKVEEEFENWLRLNKSRIVINKGVRDEIELGLQEIEYQTMAKNKVIGNMKIMVGDETVKILQIYNKEEIQKKDIKEYLTEFLEVFV